jgi:hypothetical protein
MRTMRRTAALLGAAVLMAGLGTATATAANPKTASPKIQSICSLDLGSITADGHYVDQVLSAASPPVASERRVGPQVAQPGETRASATWEFKPEPEGGSSDSGYALYGDSLYSTVINNVPGGPWWGRGLAMTDMNAYTSIARAAYPKGDSPTRQYFYAMRDDGTLVRWKRDAGGFHPLGTFAGFSAVKTMTLISTTSTYDTFLATTKAGALYTIHIPTTSPLTPVVKVVRSSTWQGFEAIVAEKCGTQSTLLAAIDTDSGSAYLYAVGHANGTATVIQSLGKVPGTFNDPTYFLRTSQAGTPLNGE